MLVSREDKHWQILVGRWHNQKEEDTVSLFSELQSLVDTEKLVSMLIELHTYRLTLGCLYYWYFSRLSLGKASLYWT